MDKFCKQLSRQPEVVWVYFFRSPTSFTRFLDSAVEAKDTLGKTYGLEHEYGTYNDALKFRFDSEKPNVAPEKWTVSVFDTKISQMS